VREGPAEQGAQMCPDLGCAYACMYVYVYGHVCVCVWDRERVCVRVRENLQSRCADLS